MKEYKIYTLAHPITNEIRYVGFTSNTLGVRLSGHCVVKEGRNSRRDNWIKNILNLGLKPIIELLEITDKNNWSEREIYWIEQLKHWNFRLINYSLGGDTTNLGVKRPKDWISPKSKPIKQYSIKGEFIKEWPSAKIVCDTLGINNMAIGQACINNRISGGFQWRFSDSIEPVSEWKGNYSKHVFQYDLKGNFIKEWTTVSQVSKELGIAHSTIFKNLNSRALSAGGFIWKYFNDTSDIIIKKDLNGYLKKVSITELSNNTTIVYESQKSAAIALGIKSSALWAIMNSKGKVPRGNKQTQNKLVRYV